MTRTLTRLVRLYPRARRERYGHGLAALLDDIPATPAAVIDLLRGAAVAHVRQRPRAATWLLAAVITVAAEVASVQAGVTANVLWAPTDPRRAVFLALTLAPTLVTLWLTSPRSPRPALRRAA